VDFVTPSDALHVNLLMFGRPKTGKTTGASTAPGSVLYINADLPNATRFIHQRDTENRIKEPVIARHEQGQTPMETLMIETVNAAYQSPTFDTFVVDPLGEMYRRILEEQSNRSRRPTLDQRGNATQDLERWCRAMCEAPVNFVMVAHAMTQDKDGSVESIPFTGSKTGSQSGIGPKLAGMVDIIAYTHALEQSDGSIKYIAQLVPGNGRDAGSRFPALMAQPVREINLAEWFALAGLSEPAA
jgi:hypothetical protein